MSKQTAVEWLLENINLEPHSEEDFKYNKKCWDKAEIMEKQQIIEAWEDGQNSFSSRNAKQYYKETFKNK